MYLHHICIQTDKYQESLKFYMDLLDMKIIDETKNFHGRDYNTWLQKDDFMIEMQTAKQGTSFHEIDADHAGIAHVCFWVDNIWDTYNNICKKGIDSFIKHNNEDVFQVNGGNLFKIIAPEGTIIEFRDKIDC